MSETADRFRNVASRLSERVAAVPDDAWDRQSPCAEWTTRGVLGHLVGNTGWFLGRAGLEAPSGPSVDEDPKAAWEAAREATQRALDDPEVAQREVESPMGNMPLEQLIGMIGVADVLIHTWDLCRAAGIDESLDPDEVHRVYEGMRPNDEMIRRQGVFGPKVEVPEDADEQTRFLAFTGRNPLA